MTNSQLAIAEDSAESQQICFRCRYVGLSADLGAKGARCPVCGFVLIVNSAPVALGRTELDELFQRPTLSAVSASPAPSRLPGVSPARPLPRARVSLPGSPAIVTAKIIPLQPVVAPAPRRKPRNVTRLLHEIAAGGLVVAGVLLALGVAGVL